MKEGTRANLLTFIAALIAIPLAGFSTMIGLGIVGVSVAYWEGIIVALLARFVLVSNVSAK
jgi:hypothetical protein